jgi:hypothetical protein
VAVSIDTGLVIKKPIEKNELMNKREWMIFGTLVGGMALVGVGAGLGGMISFAGLGIIIWLIWRGRHL